MFLKNTYQPDYVFRRGVGPKNYMCEFSFTKKGFPPDIAFAIKFLGDRKGGIQNSGATLYSMA